MQQQGSKYFPQQTAPSDPGDGVSRSKFKFFRKCSCCVSNQRESRMQQHGLILPADPYPPHTPTLGMGSASQNSTFSEHGHVAYQNKENHECSNMVANILPADPQPPTLGMWSVGQNSAFSEHGHVAYQIKENQECSNMIANILPTDTPLPTLRMGSIGQNSTFSECS